MTNQPVHQSSPRLTAPWLKTFRQRWHVYALNLVLLLILILPFYWTIISSLKPEQDIVTYPPRFTPNPWTLEHYMKLLAKPDARIMIWNSLLIALGTVCLVSFCATLAGFAVAKIEFLGRKFLFALIIMAMLLPFQSIVVPLFLEMKFFRLINTRLALILISSTFQLPLGLLIMKNAFAALPVEMIESAQIDGCSYFQAFLRILLPNVKIGIATVAIFTSATVWNDFLPALVFMTTKSKYTLPVGLSMSYQPPFQVYWGPVMSLSVITFVPTLILFLFTQRYFIAGVSAGALSAE
jgi:multiple sugar transport system permease protein